MDRVFGRDGLGWKGLAGLGLSLLGAWSSAHAAGTFTLQQYQQTPDQFTQSPQLPYWTSWTRPTSASAAAATSSLYAEWDGFVSLDATNKPTGGSAFGAALSPVPTAGDPSNATDGAFLIGGEGTANNAYYTNTPTSDIYSFSNVITPRITVPGYDIPGNQLNVIVQVQSYGSEIDPSLVTVNGTSISTLPDFSETLAKSDGGVSGGFGLAFTNDYTWTFTLPVDPASVEVDFGWGPTSAAFDAAVIDTQSVPVSVPEPASLGILALSCGMMLKRARRRRVTVSGEGNSR